MILLLKRDVFIIESDRNFNKVTKNQKSDKNLRKMTNLKKKLTKIKKVTNS